MVLTAGAILNVCIFFLNVYIFNLDLLAIQDLLHL